MEHKELAYDVVIIGAGHAGCEAANAAAKTGAKTLLLTTSLDTIGLLASSPSFGGPGKGRLLREIDAMGALMPQIADRSAIHFRRSGKNTADQEPFAICGRSKYHRYLKNRLEKTDNLDIKQDTAESVVFSRGKWEARCVTGQIFKAKCLIIAAGTFLKGRTSFGNSKQKAGRHNEIAADRLTKRLIDLGFKLGTLRTETGPTVKIDSFPATLERQQYDKKPLFCSCKTKIKSPAQICTYKTNTPGTPKEPVFLLPESLGGREWFLSGISMNFDEETQQQVVASIKGLSKAQIIQFGYSVSYRYLKPGQLMSNFESDKQPGLFFAGQVTGAKGYEEAAAQGLTTGNNAACKARKKQ